MTREDRIRKIFNISGLSQGDFAEKIGVSQQIISDVFRGKKKAGEKILLGILDNIEGVNPLWLLTGKGEFQLIVNEKKSAEKTIEERIANKIYEKISPQLEMISIGIARLSLDLEEVNKRIEENNHL